MQIFVHHAACHITLILTLPVLFVVWAVVNVSLILTVSHVVQGITLIKQIYIAVLNNVLAVVVNAFNVLVMQQEL
jgi:hypothetical protein